MPFRGHPNRVLPKRDLRCGCFPGDTTSHIHDYSHHNSDGNTNFKNHSSKPIEITSHFSLLMRKLSLTLPFAAQAVVKDIRSCTLCFYSSVDYLSRSVRLTLRTALPFIVLMDTPTIFILPPPNCLFSDLLKYCHIKKSSKLLGYKEIPTLRSILYHG